ncbi:nucleotidyl transferase AbiEii/AbiGii toxin family protein [Plantibacter sp. Leaf314]|uniref:nucleotidyl transferase AbiEii/AbiGii toxin family protein n=1 Tax=Plantibacter sp. Leaf314 TaxID=1736333 RepID=UPI0006F6CF69|nr:nucleotidyl transferase AbiEii/AbiGii toxin family protein [Plantibacter sp. Leaf314]KQQ52903.1 hypothetical protein ASF68_11650 [Plantibacter sp. Leaf314]
MTRSAPTRPPSGKAAPSTRCRSSTGTPFALAGSGAIREHGIIDRPTQDIDLFTSDLDAGRFDTAVSSVVNGIRDSGHAVDELRRVEQFARLHITTDEGSFVEMDMGVDYREGEPVTLSVGPVLSLDDAVANKVSALYSRAEARDYLDVDAIRTSGKFTDADLIAAARERGFGFEVPMFAAQLEAVQRLRPDQLPNRARHPATGSAHPANRCTRRPLPGAEPQPTAQSIAPHHPSCGRSFTQRLPFGDRRSERSTAVGSFKGPEPACARYRDNEHEYSGAARDDEDAKAHHHDACGVTIYRGQ